MSTLVIRTMSKKEIREAYGISVFVWQGWIDKLPAELREKIPPTRALLQPDLVRQLVDTWGQP